MTYREAVQKTLAEYADTQAPHQVQLLQMFLAEVSMKEINAPVDVEEQWAKYNHFVCADRGSHDMRLAFTAGFEVGVKHR